MVCAFFVPTSLMYFPRGHDKTVPTPVTVGTLRRVFARNSRQRSSDVCLAARIARAGGITGGALAARPFDPERRIAGLVIK